MVRLTLIVFVLMLGITTHVFAKSETATIFGVHALYKDGFGYQMNQKQIWKILKFDNSTAFNWNDPINKKGIYCLNAEKGFTSAGNLATRTYNLSYDMKTESATVKSKLTANGVALGDKYNKILWILDNCYVPDSSNKKALFDAAGITPKANTSTNATEYLLTNADIQAVQQAAIWYFTNSNDSNYNQSTLPELYQNAVPGQNGQYVNAMSNLDKDGITNYGYQRLADAKKLYKYLIDADNTYASIPTVEPVAPITVKADTNPEVTTDDAGNNYIMGPFKIVKNSNAPYVLTRTYMDKSSSTPTKLTGYVYLDEDKDKFSTGETLETKISEMAIGDTLTFYIRKAVSATDTAITRISAQMQVDYSYSTIRFWTNGSTFADEQPLAIVEKTPKSIQVLLETPEQKFDLALRKFITGVNDKEITNRIPKVTKNSQGKLVYTHTKVPVEVSNGDTVIYTLRIYNEGEVAGHASGIIDDVPDGLEYLPDHEINEKYGWIASHEGKRISTSYLSKTKEQTEGENLIQPFDETKEISSGNPLNPDYRDVKIAFKVVEPNTSDRILTNTAEIADDSDEAGHPITDIDSTPNNNEAGEDDIDVEHVKLKHFDLALRKFITGVNDKEITNRIPKVTKNSQGKLVYTHTKEPVLVQHGDTVIYTLRIYNEGEVAGHASGIIDDVPDGLEYLPDHEINKKYGWIASQEGKRISTSYLSKAKEQTAGANLIQPFDKTKEISSGNPLNPDYRDVKIAFKVVEPSISDRILTNTAEIADDSDEKGNPITDIDSTPNNNKTGEDDIDVEHVRLVHFDLALRKFITGVNNLEINNRVPSVTLDKEAGKLVYTHTKVPVEVTNGDTVIYTLRIYNEGTMNGYANKVIDDVPQGLEFLPEHEINKTYRWSQSEDKKQIATDYLAKENEQTAGANLIKAFDKTKAINSEKPLNPDYRDVKIAFKVVEPNTSDRIVTNTAEIADDRDEDNKPVDDIDSTPDNNKPEEDDIDVEHIKVKYFDLALRKWVTHAEVTENGETKVIETGHKAEDDPEQIVKVDLYRKNINDVTVKFRYSIRVTNEGEIAGYAKEVADYIPEGLKFVAEDNPDWYEEDGKVITKKLENTLLQPGESAEVSILLTWINSKDNMSVLINYAEINKDYNESGTPDIDSTPGNRVPGEDDIDDAPVLVTIELGGGIQAILIEVGAIALVSIVAGVVLIKKFVLE